jgi:hypothetical protein
MYIHKYNKWLVENQLSLFGHLIDINEIYDYFIEIEDELGKPSSSYVIKEVNTAYDGVNSDSFLDTTEINIGDTVKVSLIVKFKGVTNGNDMDTVRNRIYQNFNVKLSSMRSSQGTLFDIPCGSIYLDNKNYIKVANIKDIEWDNKDKPFFQVDVGFLWNAVIKSDKENDRYKNILSRDMSDWDWLYSSDDVFDWESAIKYLKNNTLDRLKKILSVQFASNDDIEDMSLNDMIDSDGDNFDMLNDIERTYTDMYNDSYYEEFYKEIENRFHRNLDDDGISYTKNDDEKYVINFDMSWLKESDCANKSAQDIFSEYCSDNYISNDINPHFPDYANVDWKTFDMEVNNIINEYEKGS